MLTVTPIESPQAKADRLLQVDFTKSTWIVSDLKSKLEIQKRRLKLNSALAEESILRINELWLRNGLRYCIWHDWKKPERKRKNLIRLGVDYGHAYSWSRTRKGGWAIAQSPILSTTITLERLRKRGYESMLDHYFKIFAEQSKDELTPLLCEPPCTRPLRRVV